MSWEQLTAIYKEAAEIRRQELQEPLVACPIDGTPLVYKRGIGNCPMGNFRTSQTSGR